MTFPRITGATSFLSPPHRVMTTEAWMEQRQRPNSAYCRPHNVVLSRTHYGILRIDVSASGDEIKAAYRRLARTYHPDVAPVDQKEISSTEFIKINAAYCTLSDPEKRSGYDKSLFPHQRPLTMTMPSPFSGYNAPNWETDQCW